ncbi:membrane protein involved in the export of O-antigen and teichoic acid [Burkholderiales bacterium JOSHI_001]|nr:membrane protein involved in the export of O-antigen and teichoic acid [Burkholderiales bacterium JOSHI_001]
MLLANYLASHVCPNSPSDFHWRLNYHCPPAALLSQPSHSSTSHQFRPAVSIRRALIFSFIDRTANILISIVSSMIVARLLTPAEIGVFSVVMVLMSFLATWRDFGAGQYLVQEQDLTPERIRAVWTVQLCIGVALAFAALAASRPVAHFYNEPRMQGIMVLIALSYFINPFGSLTYAWLMRSMRFEALTVMRSSAALCGATVSVICAWRGLGAISLAWGNLASVIANACVSFLFRPRDFPFLPGRHEIGRVLSFGTRITSTSLIEAAAKGAPELILGKLQSMTAVGLFSRANGLVGLLTGLMSDTVGSVAMPMFAQQKRDGGDLGAAFLRVCAYMSVIAWSFALFLGLMADPLIRVLYGQQWVDAVPIARWLAVAMVLAAPAALSVQVLLGVGASHRLPRAMLVSAAATITGVAVGSPFGGVGVAIGMCGGAMVATINWLRVVREVLGFNWSALLSALMRSAMVSGCTGVSLLLTVGIFGWAPARSLPVLVAGTAAGAVSFVVASMVAKHPIANEIRRVLDRLRPAG